jgi:hypothetical protein
MDTDLAFLAGELRFYAAQHARVSTLGDHLLTTAITMAAWISSCIDLLARLTVLGHSAIHISGDATT